MAEISFVQAGIVQTSGLPKPEQAPNALREASNSTAPKVDSVEKTLPAGENFDVSQKAVSQVASSEMESMMTNLNAQLEKLNNYLRFEKDQDTEKMVIMIKDTETNEVIRQIPSEDFLEVSKNITDFLETRKQLAESSFPPGLITNEKA